MRLTVNAPAGTDFGVDTGAAISPDGRMVAFVTEYPSPPLEGFFEPASALPVQVYNWTQRADSAFFERASGAIIVLLAFLFAMNLVAIILRRRFERRW